jgi:hypothetical protein
MSDLARLGIWDDPAIRDGLSWYLAVPTSRSFRSSAIKFGQDRVGSCLVETAAALGALQ